MTSDLGFARYIIGVATTALVQTAVAPVIVVSREYQSCSTTQQLPSICGPHYFPQ